MKDDDHIMDYPGLIKSLTAIGAYEAVNSARSLRLLHLKILRGGKQKIFLARLSCMNVLRHVIVISYHHYHFHQQQHMNHFKENFLRMAKIEVQSLGSLCKQFFSYGLNIKCCSGTFPRIL